MQLEGEKNIFYLPIWYFFDVHPSLEKKSDWIWSGKNYEIMVTNGISWMSLENTVFYF